MAEYDLGCLSSHEFELLICDIFQKKLNISLESFKSGRDGGIDLRGCLKGGTLIIQCKHYHKSSVSTLKSHLRDEVKKVEKINPKRYIIATSTELNPKDKHEIKDIFNNYCKSESDVFGREDIINFLRNNEDIVKKHLKLWFTSSAVLNIILNKATYNRTDFDIEDFINFLPKMVVTNDFSKVAKIVKEKNVCIISGDPGIGKSILMKALVIGYSHNGYQPIKISENIKEAYSLFSEDDKQIFYYDDFLGEIFFDDGHKKNENKDIESFIRKVKRSKNKKFILTTREYILNQAQRKSDIAGRFGENEFVISLNNVLPKIKAEILYNHLWHSQIEDDNIYKIIENKNYIKIINHRNFNPRIIEMMTNPAIINNDEFLETFFSALENPEKIWDKVYGSCISDYSRAILVILVILENQSDKSNIYDCFCRYYNNERDTIKLENEFNLSLRELDGSLIFLTKQNFNSKIEIEFKNPSVEDFMHNQIVKDDLFLSKVCDFIGDFNQLVLLWNIFKNQEKIYDIDQYPKFCKEYFLAIQRIEKEYANHKNSFRNLERFISHVVSVSGQIKKEIYIQYTNGLLKLILQKVKDKTIFFNDIFLLLEKLKEYKSVFPSYWDELIVATKTYILSEDYDSIFDFTRITKFVNITGVEFRSDEISGLISNLNELIESGILIEIDEKTKHLEISIYNLSDGCYDYIGSDISDLEELKEDIISISDLFEVTMSDLLYDIDIVINECYLDYEPDEDDYSYYDYKDKLIKEDLEFQDLFESLLDKNP